MVLVAYSNRINLRLISVNRWLASGENTMLKFFRNSMGLFVVLIVVSTLISGYCYKQSLLEVNLLPRISSFYPWTLQPFSDNALGGVSTTRFIESNSFIRYQYNVIDKLKFPYAGGMISFGVAGNEGNVVDLSRYSTISFLVKCEKLNEMTFHLHSFDPEVTRKDDIMSYRIAARDFSCSPEESKISIDLNHLSVPHWWLKNSNKPITDTQYWLERTRAISFDNDDRGPLNVELETRIASVTLHGRDVHYLWVGSAILLFIWMCYFVVMFNRYTKHIEREINGRISKSISLITYQKLSLSSRKDKEKIQLFQFMEAEFSNADLSLEYTMAQLGLNRKKINELLKSESGLTYTGYLNRLRLAEAAKQLSHDGSRGISDIAYAVGYSNVSYFNRLFKVEFGCTPRIFKELYSTCESQPL
jgi:AraC-type DNA-binding domain-containing proteins